MFLSEDYLQAPLISDTAASCFAQEPIKMSSRCFTPQRRSFVHNHRRWPGATQGRRRRAITSRCTKRLQAHSSQAELYFTRGSFRATPRTSPATEGSGCCPRGARWTSACPRAARRTGPTSRQSGPWWWCPWRSGPRPPAGGCARLPGGGKKPKGSQ